MSEGIDVEMVMQTATDLIMEWGLSAIGAIAILLIGS